MEVALYKTAYPHNNLSLVRKERVSAPEYPINNFKLPLQHTNRYIVNHRLPFGRDIKDHLTSLGANYDPKTHQTGIRLWAMPEFVDFDKGITLQVIQPENLKNNPELYKITKNVKADIPEELINKGVVKNYPMKLKDGTKDVFEVQSSEIKPGSLYRFVFHSSKDNAKLGVKKGDLVKANDPRAYYLPNGIKGWASVVDDSAYKFKHERPHFDPNEPVIIYEANIATLTKDGTFEAAGEKIRDIAKKGYTHIQIMPPWQSIGKGWGYAAVPYAISKDLCGNKDNPDDFKKFVDNCHKNGVGVIVDVNHNHLTEGFSGSNFAQYDSENEWTDWGESHNYKHPNVRNFAIDDLIRFAKVYNVDGFRFDSVRSMTKGIVRQINLELEGHSLKGDFDSKSKVLKIAEDYSFNKGGTKELSLEEIESYYAEPEKFDYSLNNENEVLGLDAVVNLDSHHQYGNVVQQKKASGRINGYEGIDGAKSLNIEKMFKHGKSFGDYPVDKLVWSLNAHDDIQDMSGTRLITKGIIAALNMPERVHVEPSLVKDFRPLEMCKKRIASRITQELLEEFKKSNEQTLPDVKKQKAMGITKTVTVKEFKQAYKKSKDLTKVAITEYLLSPGKYKMNFMGEEEGVISPFQFFLSSHIGNVVKDTSNYYLYNVSVGKALPKSNLEQKGFKNETPEIKSFYSELMEVFKENPAFKYRNEPERYWYNYNEENKDNVFEVGYKKGNKKIYAVLNLGDNEYKEYGIQLTQGKWKERINSNDKKFGGDGKYLNKDKEFISDCNTKDFGNTIISLPARSAIIFENEV